MAEQEFVVFGKVAEIFKVDLPEGIQDEEIADYVDWALDQEVAELVSVSYDMEKVNLI